MKRYIPLFVVIILVLSAIGIARANPVWATILTASRQSAVQPSTGVNSSGLYAPLLARVTVTGNGIYNVGGVCTVEINYKVSDLQTLADAEVPIAESKLVPFSGDGHLLFPGCHFVHYKKNVIVNPLNTDDGTAKVCFGASPYVIMSVYYYLDTPTSGSRVWIPLPATLEDQGRLVCAPAQYTGVYMPVAKYIEKPGQNQTTFSEFFPGGLGGSVLPPPPIITITQSGTYTVGGICLVTSKYFIPGLADNIAVEFPTKHYTEDTHTVSSDAVDGIFYFPGCHIIHYRDQKIKDEMTNTEGDWKICFAAIPDKTMTIYYYRDDLTNINPPWTALVTTTKDGLSCADPVDFSAVYAPVGK